ncbi:hypothetical protein V8C37DRAFT_286693 [Trichoderma ceciliae]
MSNPSFCGGANFTTETELAIAIAASIPPASVPTKAAPLPQQLTEIIIHVRNSESFLALKPHQRGCGDCLSSLFHHPPNGQDSDTDALAHLCIGPARHSETRRNPAAGATPCIRTSLKSAPSTLDSTDSTRLFSFLRPTPELPISNCPLSRSTLYPRAFDEASTNFFLFFSLDSRPLNCSRQSFVCLACPDLAPPQIQPLKD